MKWRLTFGDPRVSSRTIWNSAKVEVGADIPDHFLRIEAAVEVANTKAAVRHVGWVLLEAALVPDDDRIIDWLVPYPVAHLSFDPTAIKEPTLRQVWEDPLARTIWIGVKYRHLTDQYFPQECLEAAREIRRLNPKNVRELQLAMRCMSSGIKEPFWAQLLPYILGRKQIGYVFEDTSKEAAVPTEVAVL